MKNLLLINNSAADAAIIAAIRTAFTSFPKVEVCGQLDSKRRVMIRIFRNLSNDLATMPSSDELDMLMTLTDYKDALEIYHMDRTSIQRAIEVARTYPDVRLYITFRGYEDAERQKQPPLTSIPLLDDEL